MVNQILIFQGNVLSPSSRFGNVPGTLLEHFVISQNNEIPAIHLLKLKHHITITCNERHNTVSLFGYNVKLYKLQINLQCMTFEIKFNCYNT
jgi:hypothetical protein